MGSSVAAGHDGHFDNSFPVLTGKIMAPAFEAIGITLQSKNAAMVRLNFIKKNYLYHRLHSINFNSLSMLLFLHREIIPVCLIMSALR
jgi:hypothetical protein